MLTLCSTAVWAVSLPLQGGAATGPRALEQWCCAQASIPRCSAQTRRAAKHCWVLTHTAMPPATPEENDVHQSGSMLQALAGKPDKMHAFNWVCTVSCFYLQVIDVEVFFNDGVRLLLHLLLGQGRFGKRRRRRRSGSTLTFNCWEEKETIPVKQYSS